MKKESTTTTDFTLRFGKHIGKRFSETPTHYQNWLLQQEWFKVPQQQPSTSKYDVVRKFTSEYAIGMGRSYEVILDGLTWEQANAQKDIANIYQLDDCTDYFFINASKN
jgi:hypothetical protein